MTRHNQGFKILWPKKTKSSFAAPRTREKHRQGSRNKVVVITGLSSSGKSSLAFDTLYAESGAAVESLSAYARQFLGLMEKPDVDYIEGLSPAISIEQRSTGRNPRSTVGTVTEIYDYLRLLYARIGVPYCYRCGKKIERQTIQQIVDQVMTLPQESRIQVLAPIVRGRKGEYRELFDGARRDGYVRVRVDGELLELDKEIKLDKNKKHDVEIVVDRLIINPRSVAAHRLYRNRAGLASAHVIIDVIGGRSCCSASVRHLVAASLMKPSPRLLLQLALRRVPHATDWAL